LIGGGRKATWKSVGGAKRIGGPGAKEPEEERDEDVNGKDPEEDNEREELEGDEPRETSFAGCGVLKSASRRPLSSLKMRRLEVCVCFNSIFFFTSLLKGTEMTLSLLGVRAINWFWTLR